MLSSHSARSDGFRHEAEEAARLEPGDGERFRAVAAELAAALGQIDITELAPDVAARIERARTASKHLTRLVGDDATAAQGSEAEAPDEWPDLVGYRVLLAVHDRDRQYSLGRMLAEMGARYELARDGVAARTLLDGTEFDLAVIDDELTDGTGREVIARIRAYDGKAAGMPILALCAEDSAFAQQALRDAGADLVLASASSAPFARSLAAIAADSAASEPVPDTLLLDRERFDRLVEIAGGDGAAELLERLLEDLRQVEQGLGRALAEHNPAETRTQTHVLVALAGAVGADALQQLTETLNAAAHRRSPDEMTALGRQVLRQLTHLIRFLDERDAALRGDAS